MKQYTNKPFDKIKEKLEAESKPKNRRLNLSVSEETIERIKELRKVYIKVGSGFNVSSFFDNMLNDFYEYTIQELNKSEAVHPTKKEQQPTNTHVKRHTTI